VEQKRLEAAAARIEVIRGQAGIRDDAREYRREFLRVTTRWVLFLGRLQPQAVSARPYVALLDDFERWMTEERGLSRGTLKSRRWHVGRFFDWLHGRRAPVPGLSPRDLDGYLNHLHAKRLSRVSIKSHTNAVRAFKIMGLRLKRFRTRIEELLYKSAHARIAHTLLDLASDYGIPDNEGILVPLRLNQADLGNLVALARETVNTVLQDFKQRGLVEASRRNIRIIDPTRLRAVS